MAEGAPMSTMLPTPAPDKIKRSSSQQIGAAVLCLQTCLAYSLMIAPIVIVLVMSFSRTQILTLDAANYSLRWYRELLNDSNLKDGFVTSFWVAIWCSLLAVVIGTPAAVALTFDRFRFRGVLTAAFLSPLMFPTLITGAALLTQLYALGVPIFGRVLIGHLIIATPYLIRMVLVSTAQFDYRVFEAAMIHGASPIRAFFKVMLPLIRPGVVAGAIFAFVVSLGEVNISLFLTGPGVSTLPIQILSQLELGGGQIVIAAASTIQVITVTLLVIFMDKVLKVSLLPRM
jgi:putative spermidine/putrescine transport system permease protein